MQVVDRRQFIIMNKPYEREDFKYIPLGDERILSYHEDLHVVSNNALGIHLLGWAFSVNSESIVLDDDCLKNKRYWAGRWILIYKNQIYLDACGTLGCFYSIDTNNSIILSSSLHLISSVLEIHPQDTYEVKYGDGHGTFDYYPAPYTIFDEVYKILPTQHIDLNSEQYVVTNSDYMVRRYAEKRQDWIFEHFLAEIAQEMRNIANEFGSEVWITLTGGVDSRTNFSVARYSGIKFSTYTVIRKNTPKWDIDLPKKICKLYGTENIFLTDKNVNSNERERIYKQHTCGCSVGTERQQFLSNVDVPIKEKAIVLWGTVWESYLKYYHQYFKACDDIEENLQDINTVCDEIITKSSIHYRSLFYWLKYVAENPIKGLDWRERLYFEQRVGGWGSYSAQGIDLFDTVRIAPVNCQELLELLLSLDVEVADKSFQHQVIKKCCPELNKIRFGERTDFFYRAKRKITRMAAKRWS